MDCPDFCNYCSIRVDHNHWMWCKDKRRQHNGYWRCKISNRDHRLKWRDRHPEHDRLLSYQAHDRRCNRECTLTVQDIKDLLDASCYYCGHAEPKGLDRLDSSNAHTRDNCVPCCEKCNNILSDLPFEAKEKLKAGLHQIQQENLLVEWEIPTKRRSQNV